MRYSVLAVRCVLVFAILIIVFVLLPIDFFIPRPHLRSVQYPITIKDSCVHKIDSCVYQSHCSVVSASLRLCRCNGVYVCVCKCLFLIPFVLSRSPVQLNVIVVDVLYHQIWPKKGLTVFSLARFILRYRHRIASILTST